MKLGDLLPIALIFVVATLAIGIGADVIDNVQDDQTTDGFAYNVSQDGLSGMSELGGWLPTLALVVAAAIVIGVLVSAFAFGRS